MRLDADRDSMTWWQVVDRGEVLLQQCGECGGKRFPVRDSCHACGSLDSAWVPALGAGRVSSWIVHRRPTGESYAVLCVRLDEGEHVLMQGNLVDGDPTQITPGMRVQAVVRDGLVRWRPFSAPPL
ncbi:OB-fold domain-containing protein [Actinocorallia sp. B10E7]|uniref:Zn-ribbon domain-containing OB-fold protein n=1 Tax=Actinocorallia sp. B10E7 TaxID=3153558 RepID=UPI00325CA362